MRSGEKIMEILEAFDAFDAFDVTPVRPRRRRARWVRPSDRCRSVARRNRGQQGRRRQRPRTGS